MPASGLPIALEVLILFPWDPVTRLFLGERICVRPRRNHGCLTLRALEQRANLVRQPRLRLLVIGEGKPAIRWR